MLMKRTFQRYKNEYSQSGCDLTSLILDLRNGFLMYQVEVRNVSTNVNSSIFPDSSNLSGDVLDWVQALNMKELLITHCTAK